MAAPRLTEEEVHEACAEIAAQGERPRAVTLLDRLGRGSLTTITKYLNSWNASDDAKVLGVETLPTVIQLPSELAKDGEGLVKKIWAVAKGLADDELDIQREALKQAEIANQAKVEEAFQFSEAQALQIERLDDAFMSMKAQLDEKHRDYLQSTAKLNEAEKTIVGLSKDNDQLRHEISDLKSQLAAMEEANKAAVQEQQDLQKEQAAVLKQKDAEIRSLDMQVHKLQTSLDSTVKTNDQLKADIKSKASELSSLVIELEKLNVRHEAAVSELKTVKSDLKAATKAASEAEKLVANLEGQLAVYKSLEPKAANDVDGATE
jgi:chromosome segregation ATPase